MRAAGLIIRVLQKRWDSLTGWLGLVVGNRQLTGSHLNVRGAKCPLPGP